MSQSDMRAECRLSLSRKRYLRDSFFPVCSPELLARGKRKIERAADLLHYPLIHFDWMNRDPKHQRGHNGWQPRAPLTEVPNTDKAWDLSFREELHAIDVGRCCVRGRGYL